MLDAERERIEDRHRCLELAADLAKEAMQWTAEGDHDLQFCHRDGGLGTAEEVAKRTGWAVT